VRSVDPIDCEGDDKPEKHHVPLGLHSGEHREHRENSPSGGEKVDGEGAVLWCHEGRHGLFLAQAQIASGKDASGGDIF
jgi:hypothetical protein